MFIYMSSVVCICIFAKLFIEMYMSHGWQKGPYDKILKFNNDAYFKNSIHVEPFLKISMIYHIIR